MSSSERDPNSFTNLREHEIIVPGGALDNSSSVVYDVRSEVFSYTTKLIYTESFCRTICTMRAKTQPG